MTTSTKFTIEEITTHIVSLRTYKELFPRPLAFGTFKGLIRVMMELKYTIEEEGKRKKGIAYGEAVPSFPFTIETPLYVKEIADCYFKPNLEKKTFSLSKEKNIEEIIHSLLLRYEQPLLHHGLNITYALLDTTLHDLWGKIAKKPLWRLYQETPFQLKGKMIWSLPQEITQAEKEAKRYLPQGYALKIKLYGKPEEDAERTKRILLLAKEYPKKTIVIDANQSYNFFSFKNYLTKVLNDFSEQELIQEYNCFIEEPYLIQEKKELLPYLKTFRLPLMLDESIRNNNDLLKVESLIKKENIPSNRIYINIKIHKVGGIKKSYELIQALTKKGMRVMIGGMFPSSYGKLVNVHVAMITPHLLPSDGIHPSKDYIKEPLISNRKDLEKTVNGWRDFRPLLYEEGIGGKIVRERLYTQSLQVTYPRQYFEKGLQPKSPL